MTRMTSLSPTPVHTGSSITSLIRTQEICPGMPAFPRLEQFVRLHVARLMATASRESAALYAVIDGPPGTGKTLGTGDALVRAGLAVCNVPAAMLAGASENAATEALTELFEGAVAYSKATRLDVAIVIDDFHLSIAGSTDARIGRTVNTGLLTAELQRIADAPRPYRNGSGIPVPVLFTGNDFSETAPSLFRDGRANRFTHQPDEAEKAQIIYRLLAPRSREEWHLVDKLTRTYRRQPIAFWVALRDDLIGARVARSLPAGKLDPARVDALLPKRVPLDRDVALAVARTRARATLSNHYAR